MSGKIIIFDAVDRIGKDTQISLLKKYLIDRPILTFHYSGIKGISPETSRKYSEILYTDGFEVMKKLYKDHHMIFNRFNIGEYVYSPIYRGYDGEYIFDIEKKFKGEDFWNNLYLISFTDTVENLLKREDGESLSFQGDKKEKELLLFKQAVTKSLILHKIIIDINKKSIQQVHEEIKGFLNIK